MHPNFWDSPEGRRLSRERADRMTPEQCQAIKQIDAVKDMSQEEMINKLATEHNEMNIVLRNAISRALYYKVKTSIAFLCGEIAIEMTATRIIDAVRKNKQFYCTLLMIRVYEQGKFLSLWGITFDTSTKKNFSF